MTTLFLACALVIAAAALYVPVVRAWTLWRRYGKAERQFIRATEGRLERDPGELASALALLDLYRTHGDHVRLRALYQHTRGHLEGRPEYEPLRRAALVGPFVMPKLIGHPEMGGGNSFFKDAQQASGRLRLEGLTFQGLVEIVQVEVEIAGMGGEQSAVVPPEVRVLSLEAVISEDRINATLSKAEHLPPGLSDVRIGFASGEITLSGSFFRVPFKMALAVRPASERAALFHLPRAVQILGIPTIPATILAEKIIQAIQSKHPEIITVLDGTTFVLDLVAGAPMPIQLNLSSVAVAAGELMIQARAGQAARLDLGPWRLPASHAVAPEVPQIPSVTTSGDKAHDVTVTSSSPEEYRRALSSGQLEVALSVGLRLLASRPLDRVLREELVSLALRTGESKRAIEVALERLADLPGGPEHPSPRLCLMAGQALAGLGRKDEAEVHLEGLEGLLGVVGDAVRAQDLMTLATLRVRLFGDLERGAHALEQLALVAGPAPRPGESDPMIEPLRQGVQLAWEAGRADVCERLARRLVKAAPFESSAWRLLGLALKKKRQGLSAYSALAAAAWLNPLDRVAVAEADTQRGELARAADTGASLIAAGATGSAAPVTTASATGGAAPVTTARATGSAAPVTTASATGSAAPVTTASATGGAAPVTTASATGVAAPVTTAGAANVATPMTTAGAKPVETALEASGVIAHSLADALHPAEVAGAGPVLRLVVPEVAELLMDEPPVLQETLAVASDATHPDLMVVVRGAAGELAMPVPEVLVIPDTAPVVEAGLAARPTIRVHAGAISELTRDELVFAVARAVWQAGRGDVRWRRLARPQHRMLTKLLETLRGESAWRARAEALAESSIVRSIAPRAFGDWAEDVFEETWPYEAAAARLIEEPLREQVQSLARELDRKPIAADVEAWCAALDFSADRAALLVCRDVAAALGALLKGELRSRTLLAQVRERGLPWALQTLLPGRFAPRIRELLLRGV